MVFRYNIPVSMVALPLLINLLQCLPRTQNKITNGRRRSVKIEIRAHEVHKLLLLPWQVQNSFRPRLSITVQEENCTLGHVTRPLKPRTPLLPICNKQLRLNYTFHVTILW